MKTFKLMASMILAATLALLGLTAPAYACACGTGSPTMTLTTSEVAGRIQVELVDEANAGSTDEVKYYITIYSDAGKSNVVSEADYFENAGTFLTQELSPSTEYWVEARTAVQNPGGGWWMSSDSAIASAVTGAASEESPSVALSPSSNASSLHISIDDAHEGAWYNVVISGSADFSGLAWFHTTQARELDVELTANQTYFVKVTRVYWDSVKQTVYAIGLPAIGSTETSVSNADARLADLQVEGFELNETFSPDVFNYTLTVPTEVSEISIAVAALNGNSSMTLNKSTLNQKEFSTSVELSYEDNYLVIDVTSADASTSQQYLILVTRQVPVSFYDKPTVEDKSSEASGEVKRTLTGAESDGQDETSTDTTAEPEETAMPSTGGEESQSGVVTEEFSEVAGDSNDAVLLVSSVAVLALAGFGFVLYRRRKV